MLKPGNLAIILFLVLSVFSAGAQENECRVGLRGGYDASSGGFAALSLETRHTFRNDLGIGAGLRYSSTGKLSAQARPAYFMDFPWGKLRYEVLVDYALLKSINSFAAGAGIGLYGRWIGGRLGYYYRLYGVQGNFISEPLNVYYELRAEILPMIDRWDLSLIITNDEMFELERHFQPSFIASCRYYPGEHVGMTMSVGCTPSGMFNVSADNYRSHLKLGLCYRW